MASELKVKENNKRERYEALYRQLQALLLGESDLIANMANVVAALKEEFGFFWVGFYRVSGNQLLLGPFQGPVACSRIAYGKGVCGTAWKEEQVVVVPDVHRFPGHIACSSLSRSEIVLPVWSGDRVVAVLDVDSDQLDAFDEIDAYYLEKVCGLLSG